MNVNDLKQFLQSLSRPLSVSGAKKTADDLDRMCAGLEPFCDLTVAQFADFLANAEAYGRTGIVPMVGRAKSSGAKAAAKAADPQVLAAAVNEVRSLYDRVSSPEVTYRTIEAEVKRLDKQFSKDAVLEIARGIDVSGTPKTKKAALEEIQRRMTERKESFERTRF
jgi:alpha-glucuronidase